MSDPDKTEAKRQRLDAQRALYNDVLDYLCRTQLLLRIADDHDTVRSVLYTDAGRQAALREYEQLSDADLKELHETVAQHWSLNVNLAVRKLWHAAEVLGFQAGTLDPQLVAMTAATYFSMAAEDLVAELEAAIG